ncbi:hypothetical protein MGN70_004284 [Eutypa lata]|uniref:Putative ethyl tert-butyl ether degradation protein n=1 Tax=Eutypa lata (strain UCR-EL1) TaxID=1287681 RepID=M7S6S6_EUTLA|nr:putative ethyl tert-butyl ether degradation protein [Eutypa lata UCREL1]KAI1253889.1 hypothetical protein MGN70_004284 [Eutypa lata]
MSSKQSVVNVIYPKEAKSDFNMDYYLKTHMPLVAKIWGPHGLKSWSVATLDEDSGFYVQAVLVFESLEAFQKAPTGDIFGDIKNFTNTSPVKWVGNLEATSTV